jgi:hypothetical protein
MSYRLKVIIFVLATNIIALAAGYLMRGMGLHWFIPVILAIACLAVLVSRRWLKKTRAKPATSVPSYATIESQKLALRPVVIPATT